MQRPFRWRLSPLDRQYGQPLRILSTVPTGPNSATIKIEYDKSIANADIIVEAAAPNKVIGLLIKGFEVKGDSLAKIDGDFAKLPGATGYLVEKISKGGQRSQIAGRNVTQSFAIASTFPPLQPIRLEMPLSDASTVETRIVRRLKQVGI